MSKSVILANASPATGNRGVAALWEASVRGLLSFWPDVSVTTLNYEPGFRVAPPPFADDAVRMMGAALTRQVHRSYAFSRIRFESRFLPFGTKESRVFRDCDAVFDVSGGDSFTDFYGDYRYRATAYPKRIAQELGKPLVLLPQTYGPFREDRYREDARAIVRRATMAWSRDARSHALLLELLGSDYDETKHRSGVDVAFLLPARAPTGPHADRVHAAFERLGSGEMVGLNVSGLVYAEADGGEAKYGYSAHYRELVLRVARGILDGSECSLMLLPHVIAPGGNIDSDPQACDAVAAALGCPSRVWVAPPELDQAELKWLVGRCSWFCGTRMHSTIAGLSQGVPTTAISYSPKTIGVFETCDAAKHVIDPIELNTDEAVDTLLEDFTARTRNAGRFRDAAESVRARAMEQMAEIAQSIGDVKK